MNEKKKNARSRAGIIYSVFLLLLAGMLFVPLPYYLYQPGTVEKIANYVKVENGAPSKDGSFSLTTVFSSKVGNTFTLLYGLLAPDTEVRKATKVRGSLTDAQYKALLEHMMKRSQNSAVVAALGASGKEVPVKYTGIFVQSIYAGSKAEGIVFPGDIIIEADGQSVTKLDDMLAMLDAGKKPGDTIKLGVLRDDQQLELAVELYGLAGSDPLSSKAYPRIGLVTEDQFQITPPVKVEFTVSDIGGPSAGLMFALEIADQLDPAELTHGLTIAGTGTIDASGKVGQIGGIRDKIIAADRAGVDLFFSPADVNPNDSNAKDILDEAKKRKYDITIVPVSTLDEALDYLKKLDSTA
ncbi:SepM family pheromone-processing serine protease [Paenibacillus harenae]|uniref:endopeptidase La n=1 Tax=Paenibacillus harenae TaxID=306543 RepID=A0ABT9U875_PAEHA|nr:SepM family pheromone-processing serine protease [Paenibacillus harenae]MDQ0115773.1 PDZ domain-containing protein [Paenibacillus harenae]